jgi:predicted Fe-Mo cluster-binding NifX family protein
MSDSSQVKLLVTANGRDLDAPTSPIFGRCPTYIVVEPESLDFEVVDNPAVSAGGGAGIQAAQLIVDLGVNAVLTGNVGPNAFGVLQSAQVPVYLCDGGTVRQAVEAFKAGQLSAVGGASTPSHSGLGRGMGRRGRR